MFSDSMSSLQALDSRKINSKTVLGASRALNKLASRARRLTLCWIRAHVGHEGNECADKLAKDATTLINLERLHLSISAQKESLRVKIYDQWKDRWENHPTCRQTKQFCPLPDAARGKRFLKLARSQLSLLVKLLTGHNNLSYHASKIDPTIYDMCSFCDEEKETFFHLVTECPSFRVTRQEIGIIESDNKTWTQERLLELARVPAIEALLNRF